MPELLLDRCNIPNQRVTFAIILFELDERNDVS